MSFRYRLVCMKHQTLGRVVPRLAQGHLYAGRPGHALRRQRENLKQPRVDPRRGVGYGACEYACTLQEDPAVYVTGIGERRLCAARSCLIASKGVRSVNLNSSQWMLAAATVAFLAAFALYEHALAIIALDRNAAHLSEQLALKPFVPVLALNDDRTLTSADVPWIFPPPRCSAPGDSAASARSGRSAQRPQPAAGQERSGLRKSNLLPGLSPHRQSARSNEISSVSMATQFGVPGPDFGTWDISTAHLSTEPAASIAPS